MYVSPWQPCRTKWSWLSKSNVKSRYQSEPFAKRPCLDNIWVMFSFDCGTWFEKHSLEAKADARACEWGCGWVSGARGVYVSKSLCVSDVIKGKDGRGMPDTERNKNPQIVLISSAILKLIKRNIPNFHFF